MLESSPAHEYVLSLSLCQACAHTHTLIAFVCQSITELSIARNL